MTTKSLSASILERVLGPEHPDTLNTRAQFAFWLGRAGDAAGAVAAFAELLPILERVLGPEHPDTLTTRKSLSSWQHRGDEVIPLQIDNR